MDYDEAGVSFAMRYDTVSEVRIESNKHYSYEGKIGLGSSLEDVISFFGGLSEAVTGEKINWFRSNVLYKDVEGEIGRCYMNYKEVGVRMFFMDYKVSAIYLCKPNVADPNINEKVKRIVTGKTTREQVMEVFGEPGEYYGGKGERLSEQDALERIAKGLFVAMAYDNGLHFAIYGDDTVREVRIEFNEEYRYEGKIGLSSSLEDVISLFGEPSETVTGETIDFHKDRVLYKDTKGETGHCYIDYKDIGVRMFFLDYKVCAFYMRVPGTTP
jgi:hypothetical protein